MAVSKKSDYVGNHEGRYLDNSGQSKQFTYIDHDVKLSLSMPITDSEITEAKNWLKNYRIELVQKIVNLPPTMCPEIFHDFTLRGDRDKIEWNETMLQDDGLPADRLRDIYILTSNRIQIRSEGLL